MTTSTKIVDVVPEVQRVSLLANTGEDVDFVFLEQDITVTVGTDTPADIQAALEDLITVSSLRR